MYGKAFVRGLKIILLESKLTMSRLSGWYVPEVILQLQSYTFLLTFQFISDSPDTLYLNGTIFLEMIA